MLPGFIMTSSQIGVIVAHPDDEVLAFGGSIARHASLNDDVHILILATGLTSRDGSSAHNQMENQLERLRTNAKNAAEILGAQSIEFCDFPDNSMDTVPLLKVIKKVEKFIHSKGIEKIYTHYDCDINIDHEITNRAVITASRSLPESTVCEIYAGEILSSSEFNINRNRFIPDTYIELSYELDCKIKAIQCYTDELQRSPHPRSVDAIRALAILRGSEAGVKYAESLKLLRQVIKK